MKKIVTTILILCTLAMVCSAAFAAVRSYDFIMTTPFIGSSKVSYCTTVATGHDGYVCPGVNTYYTKYSIWSMGARTVPNLSQDSLATNYLSIATTGKKYFTYRTGFGGVNTGNYCMWVYPDVEKNPNYADYRVYGTWAP